MEESKGPTAFPLQEMVFWRERQDLASPNCTHTAGDVSGCSLHEDTSHAVEVACERPWDGRKADMTDNEIHRAVN